MTNPLRTLVDFAGVADDIALDAAVDRALASQLVTVAGILAEVDRLGRRGRPGVRATRRALQRRGFIGAPHPSVLESRILRLLNVNRIEVLRTEVWLGEDGRYRIDAELSSHLLVEVDGYAHHHTPEQKTDDERRRNRIRLGGKFLLVYTWRDVVYDGRRVVAEVRRALAQSSVPQLTGAVVHPPIR